MMVKRYLINHFTYEKQIKNIILFLKEDMASPRHDCTSIQMKLFDD